MSEFKEGNGSTQVQDRPGQLAAEDGASPHGTRGPQPEAFARVKEETPPPPKKPLYKRPLVLIIVALIIIGGIVGGVVWWLNGRNYEATDDAFIQANVTQVSPRVAGHVDKVYVVDNQDVVQGDKLLELDPSDLQAKVAESEAAVAVAQGGVQQARDMAISAEADVGQSQAAQLAAQTEADRAHNELQRYEKLSAQAVTQQQMINLHATAAAADAQLGAARQKTVSAQAHVKSAQSQIQLAEAQVKQADAALHASMLQLSYTTISAPVAGHVTNKSVQPGDYVQAGQALLALVPHEVYIIANFKETQLDLMKPDQPVDITADAFPGHRFHGTVQSIQRGSGAAFSLLPPENATGNYVKVVQRVPVKIKFDSEGYPLGPGMSVMPAVKVR